MTTAETLRDTCRELWGKPSRSARFTVERRTVDVLRWDPNSTPDGLALYLTVGASEWPVPGGSADRRIEFVTSLLPARDEIAEPLAALSLYSILQGVTVDHGNTVPSEGPLWRRSAMNILLVTRPRVGFLPAIESPDGSHLQFLQAIPIFESERAYKKEYGTDALLECFAEAHTPFWDPDRAPNPVCLSRSGLGAGTFLGV